MANLGTAHVTIAPKFEPGLSEAVRKALGDLGVGTSIGQTLGQDMGAGAAKGFAKAGAVAGVVSSLTSTAVNTITSTISSSMGAAISRFDTLNRYPAVMEGLGYSAREANDSITLMSERLTGLPTALDSMVGTVQGLTAITGDLDRSTQAGLALNDMLLAGGASTQIANSALEQFRQILSKGKPEMQDWRTLLQAAPGQMDQLAKSMLGPTANANDLYAALGGGKNTPTKSMDDLLDAIIRLDQEGGDGFASFEEQARNASNGIQTSMANIQTAVTRGLADIMDDIGQDNISGVFKGIQQGVKDAFASVSDVLGDYRTQIDDAFGSLGDLGTTLMGSLGQVGESIRPIIDVLAGALPGALDAVGSAVGSFGDVLSGLAGVVAPVVSALEPFVGGIGSVVAGNVGQIVLAFKTFETVSGIGTTVAQAIGPISGVLDNVSLTLKMFSEVWNIQGGGIKGFFGALKTMTVDVNWAGPIVAGIAGIATVAGLVATEMQAAAQREEDFRTSTEGVADSVKRLSGLSTVAGDIRQVGEQAQFTALSMDEIIEQGKDFKASLDSRIESYESEAVLLDKAAGLLHEYAGQADLTEEQVGNLKWALDLLNEKLGTDFTMDDALKNEFMDANGEAQNLCATIDTLIEKTKAEAKAAALSESLTEAYRNQREAASTYADTKRQYDDRYDETLRDLRAANARQSPERRMDEQTMRDTAKRVADEAFGEDLEKARGQVDSYTEAVEDLTGALGENAEAASETASAYDRLDFDTGRFATVGGVLRSTGQSTTAFKDALEYLGVDIDRLCEQSPEALESMAAGFDGSAASIVGSLESMGVGFDSVRGMMDTLKFAVGEDAFGPLVGQMDAMGISVDDLVGRMRDAGMGAEDMASLTSDAMAAMVEASGGDIDRLIDMIRRYNEQAIDPKTADVEVNDMGLTTAEGHVIEWNGTELIDKSTGVAVETGELTDAQGQVWVWNGTALVPKSATATVTGNAADGTAKAHVDDTTGAIQNLPSKGVTVTASGNAADGSAASNVWNLSSAIAALRDKTITITQYETVQKTVRSVTAEANGGRTSGGQTRLMAGGIRRHADGFIANNPGGGVPLGPRDIVGENGAEAIIPLTNRRYATPFVDMIADAIGERIGAGAPINVNVNGAVVNDDAEMQQVTRDFLTRIVRYASM